MEREKARLEGQRGQFISDKARSLGKIDEIKVQMIQIDEDDRTQTLTEMRDVEAKIAELKERQVAAESRLERTSIRSPIAGDIYQLNAHTIGGVIGPGETIMMIAPRPTSWCSRRRSRRKTSTRSRLARRRMCGSPLSTPAQRPRSAPR